MYAAAVMKLIISLLIREFDFELVEKEQRRWWVWRSSMLPMENTLVAMKPRETTC